MTLPSILRVLAILPLLPPLHKLYQLVANEDILGSIIAKLNNDKSGGVNISADGSDVVNEVNTVGVQLLLFLILGILGHFGTYRLIPGIRYYMLKRGICGKDLGKKGTDREDVDV